MYMKPVINSKVIQMIIYYYVTIKYESSLSIVLCAIQATASLLTYQSQLQSSCSCFEGAHEINLQKVNGYINVNYSHNLQRQFVQLLFIFVFTLLYLFQMEQILSPFLGEKTKELRHQKTVQDYSGTLQHSWKLMQVCQIQGQEIAL